MGEPEQDEPELTGLSKQQGDLGGFGMGASRNPARQPQEHSLEQQQTADQAGHLDALAAPMLVIQGRNDPRVVVGESDRLVDELRSQGKDIEYLVFDDEGHDMVKHENKVTAYAAILNFFRERLGVL